MHARMHARTHTHTIILRLSGLDNPGDPVPQETFTHSQLSWSSVIPYLLPLSITIHGILPVQFTCLTVFFYNLSPLFVSKIGWIMKNEWTQNSCVVALYDSR